MAKNLDDLVRSLAEDDVGLFYYSGHGLQFDGENYLVPVDSRLEEPEDLQQLTIKVADQLEAMRNAARVSLVILDACRDDPFKSVLLGKHDRTRRVLVRPSGLNEVKKSELRGALIAFSAEQGQTADDGEEGELSPFTKALLDHLERPGLEILDMMRLVKQAVQRATSGKQTPWSNDSLTEKFYFCRDVGPDALEPPAQKPLPVPPPLAPIDDAAAPVALAHVQAEQPDASKITFFNLAAKLEKMAIAAGPVALVLLSITAAFILLMSSYLLHFGFVSYDGKEVGQLYAPNWVIVYTILFPFYLGFYAVFTEQCKLLLDSLSRQRIILGATGDDISPQNLSSAWNENLRKASVIVWGLLIVIIAYESAEWTRTCLLPLVHHDAGNSVVDWSTAAAAGLNTPAATAYPSINTSIAFSLASYLYMAVALFIYLSILVIETAFCLFLSSVANPIGYFRMLVRDSSFGARFSSIGICIYSCCTLGVCAGYMMRLQATYLESHYGVIWQYFL